MKSKVSDILALEKAKKATNFIKLYLLPKIHKRLRNVPGRPVISNCGSSTEKCSEFLDYHLKSIMQNSWSIILALYLTMLFEL